MLRLGHHCLGERAGDRLDAPHAGRHRALGDDLEIADVAGAADMRAAAQLDRIRRLVAFSGTHRDDAHLLAVFLAEQRHRTQFDRGVRRHQPRRHLAVLAHTRIHLGLHPGDVLAGQRSRLRDVEAQPVRRVQAALLRDMRTQPPAQRLVQQMRRRMVRADRGAPRVVHLRQHRHAHACLTCLDAAEMHEQIAQLPLRIGYARCAGHRHR